MPDARTLKELADHNAQFGLLTKTLDQEVQAGLANLMKLASGDVELAKSLLEIKRNLVYEQSVQNAIESQFDFGPVPSADEGEEVLRWSLAWMKYVTWGIPADYGTSLGKLLAFVLGWMVSYALVFYVTGRIRLVKLIDGRRFEGNMTMRLWTPPSEYVVSCEREIEYRPIQGGLVRSAAANLLHCFWFSWEILLRVGRAQRHLEFPDPPTGATRRSRFCRRLGTGALHVLWMSGFYFLVALFLTFKNTSPFLQSLLGLAL